MPLPTRRAPRHRPAGLGEGIYALRGWLRMPCKEAWDDCVIAGCEDIEGDSLTVPASLVIDKGTAKAV